MKKLLSILLALCVILGLAGCGKAAGSAAVAESVVRTLYTAEDLTRLEAYWQSFATQVLDEAAVQQALDAYLAPFNGQLTEAAVESFTAGGTFTFFDEYAEANGVTLTVKDVTLKDVTTAQDTPQYTYTATITCQKADGTFAEKTLPAR